MQEIEPETIWGHFREQTLYEPVSSIRPFPARLLIARFVPTLLPTWRWLTCIDRSIKHHDVPSSQLFSLLLFSQSVTDL